MNDRWEILKAIAVMAVGCGVFLGLVLAGGAWLHPAPREIIVHLDQPLVVKVVP